MKKIFLLALPLLALSFNSCSKNDGGGDIIKFKDDALLKALVALKTPLTVDKNGDKKISTEEARRIKILDLSGGYGHNTDEGRVNVKIKNMEEIKYFTNLEIFNCSENDISVLDLSSNINLRQLECSDNQLTSIDLHSNTSLEMLLCSRNKLRAIDLSNNSDLEHFECSGNLLTAVNLRYNKSLTVLLCSMNELSALDLSENPALTKLWCYDNQLSELDLSKNTALETILCYDNYLTTLYLNNSHILPDYDINHIKDEYPDITIEYVD